MNSTSDLFLAILAMDAYNRTIGDVATRNLVVSGTSIGNVNLSIATGDTSSGFFAQSYVDNVTGQKIIAYRGTDVSAFGEGLKDVSNGWTVGAGLYSMSQATLAAQFFQSVVQNGGPSPSLADLYGSNIALTGHSLGGGLAGLIASIYHQSNAKIFDSMDFAVAAQRLYEAATTQIYDEQGLPVGFYDEAARDLFFRGSTPDLLSSSGITNYSVQSQALSAISGYPFSNWGGAPGGINKPEYSLGFDGILDGIQRHSASLLVIRMFADVFNVPSAWLAASKYILPKLFDDSIAQTLGILSNDITGTAAASDKMRDMIAYSAIDEGTLVYGDTGIRALFDDAGDLGGALALSNVSSTLVNSAESIGAILTQFAGQLAKGMVTKGDHQEALAGILSLSSDQQTLAIDFSDHLWSLGRNSPQPSIIGRTDLIEKVFAGYSASEPIRLPGVFQSGMKWLWNSDDLNVFDRFVFATTNDALSTTLTDRGHPSSKVTLFAAGGSDDSITGSRDNDFIYGGDGKDVIRGEDGNDLLAGGAGDDRLSGGEGNDYLAGGAGKDTVFYEADGSGVELTINGVADEASGSIPTLELTGGSGDVDRVKDVEVIELTDQKDTVHVGTGLQTLSGTILIDALGQAAGQRDVLDFSGLTQGVTITQPGDAIVVGLLGDAVRYKNFEEVTLTSSNDWVFGLSGGVQRLNTGGGNDIVTSTSVGTTIDLGTGNDTLLGSGAGTIVYTGDGEDRIEISHSGQMLVTDASTLDRMTMYGVRLTGGIHWHASESPYAYGKLLERYGRNHNGDLVIKDWFGNETFVANFNFAIGGSNLTAGIYVIDLEVSFANIMHLPEDFSIFNAWEDLMGHAMKAMTGYSAWGTTVDPLVFDLNGDGLTLSLRDANNASFDIDQDGFSEHVGWVRGGDGFLVRDISGNGVIDNIGEMFGNEIQSGFAQLATLDGNHDGKVDAADNGLADFNKDGVIDAADTFDTLKMWIDANEDGKTDAGELVSLESLGIASISVSSTLSNTTSVGNTIVATGTFTRTDGTTGTVGHVDFKVDDFNTKWLGDNSVSAEAATRANLKGHGTLADLHVAMTIDPALATAGQQGAPPTLIEIVDANLANLNVTDLSALREAARPILTGWANAVPVPAGTPGQQARADFNLVVEQTIDGPVVRDFLIQKSDELGTYWGLASGNAVRDENGDVIARPTREQVLASAPENGSWAVLSGEDIRFLERYLGDEINLDVTNNPGADAIAGASTVLNFAWHELDKIAVRLASQGPLESFFAGVEYDAVTDTFKPTTTHQLVPMLEAIFGATPATTFAAETFIAGWKDVIDVMMPDFQRPDGLDVTFAYLFQNLVGAYENVPISLTLQQAASVLDIPQGIIKTGAGNLNGTAEADLLYLDSSDQYAQGGAGYDSYVVGRDFGHDTIQDVWEGLGESQEDAIRFAHLNANELSFRRDGLDLIITQIGTDNEIRVVDEFAGRRPGLVTAYQDFDKSIEIITFADGTVWDKIDIAKAVGMTSYATDDTLMGSPDVDVLNGGLGNDYMSGGTDGDHYMFGRGDGHDTIEDNQGYNWMEALDFVHFGAGISLSDLSFERDGNSNDLRIGITGADDILTITGQFRLDYGLFNSSIDRIEVFTFADGGYIGWEDVLKTVIASEETEGDDIVHGFSYTDTLDGGAGNDYLSGHNESDTYIFGRGYGHDTVHDDMDNILASDTDVVVFKDVAYSDVTFQRIGNSEDFSILINGTDDKLTVQGQFGILYGLYNVATDRIEQFKFSDGTILSWEDIIHNFNAAAGTDGNDVIYGFNYADTLAGGEGDDVLQGGREDDTYVYNRGDGNDTIIEVADAQTSAFDTLVLHGIAPSSVSLVRDGNDITLVIAESAVGAGDGGSVRLKDEGDDFFSEGVERITFDDGTVWTQNDVRLMLIAQASTSGNDTIAGFNTNDTFRGGAGDDALAGKAGNDTYIYARGDGHDVVTEAAGDGVDTLVLEGVNPSEVSLVRNGNHLTLVIAESASGAGDGGSILLKAELDNYFSQGVEKISFADGTIWNQNDLRVMLLAQASTAGNDTITGFNTNDTLRGGVGNDAIYGREGDDTYIYARGDGHDTITEVAGGNYSTIDTLMLEGLNPSDVSLTRSGNDVTLIIAESVAGAGDGGSILLKDEVNDWFSQGVEKIQFADGTIWTQATIRSMLTSAAGTPGDDVIAGTSSSDIIAGGLGNDALNGGTGDDIYIYNRGDGNDVITEAAVSGASNFDTLSLNGISPSEVSLVRNGNHLTLVIAESAAGAGDGGSIVLKDELDNYFSQGVQQVTFSDGTVWSQADLRVMVLAQASTSGNDTIVGFNTNDTMRGGAGDDALSGVAGDDTYIYARGDGHDTITEITSGNFTTIDTLVLEGLNPSDVSLVRNGNDLTLVIAESVSGAGDGGSILLKAELDNYFSQGVEKISFADGTIWTQADLRVMVLAQAATSDNDTIVGFNTSDTLRGGAGDDALNGANGDDTYIYARGDGDDVITEGASSTGSNIDALVLEGLNPSDVSLVRNGNDLTLVIAESVSGAGDGGSILLKAELDNYFSQGVESIRFADGTVWTQADLRVMVLAQAATSDNDTIVGFNTGDVLQGGAGNDTMIGGAGGDTYVYARGDGNDIINDQSSSGVNSLVLHGIATSELTVVRNADSAILLIGAGGVDGQITIRGQFNGAGPMSSIRFDDDTVWTAQMLSTIAIANDGSVVTHAGTSGADTIVGTSDIDVIDGGAAGDTLRGEGGSDFYRWGAGSGNDTIIENSGASDTDTIHLMNLNSADLSFGRLGNDLYITIAATGEILKVQGHFNSTTSGIEQIKFADNTTWDRAQIASVAWFVGTSAGETIDGLSSDDIIDGRGGNDTLRGRGGNDTYLFGVGSGNDTVIEGAAATDGDGDMVKLLGLNPSDVTFIHVNNSNHLVIQINSTGETLYVQDQFNGTNGIEQVLFADGSTWDRSQIQTAAWYRGTASGENIYGSGSADTIDGKGGNDYLQGRGGDDTYIYAVGYGNDTIYEGPSEGTNDVVKLVGLNSSDVTFGRINNTNHLVIQITSTGETLTIQDQLNGTFGIEQVVFADNTSWDRGQILSAAWIRGTAGNDTLYGTSGNDVFVGGLGNDQFNSGAGSDTYVYALGDGNDYINDESGSTTDIDVLRLTDLNASDLTFSRVGVNLVATVNSNGQTITIDEQFYSQTANWGIEKIEFADGTSWNLATINANAWYRGTSGNDTMTGSAWNDTLAGGAGNDTMTGGAGSDTFVFRANLGQDVVSDFSTGSDVLEFRDGIFADAADALAHATASGSDTLITIDATNTVLLKNVSLASLHESDFHIV